MKAPSPEPAIILTGSAYQSADGKAAHGLVRGTERFSIRAVVDEEAAGADAGELLDGQRRDIPVVSSIQEALTLGGPRPEVAIVGLATHGGRLTPEVRALILRALEQGLSVVSGLHDFASEDVELEEEASRRSLRIIDLRKPKPRSELRFWTGAVRHVRAPRVAVLGTDCALGKRTTARLLTDALVESGLTAEMIYTGQTGWLQGSRYGFVLDSVVNDYVSGELEHAVVTCDQELAPDVMILEGQSALRNPSGPCGAELLLSAGARGVVLQHAPGREFFEGYEDEGFRIPPIEEELQLISLYGARTLAVTLNGEGVPPGELEKAQKELQERLALPVVRPLEEGVGAVASAVRAFAEEERT